MKNLGEAFHASAGILVVNGVVTASSCYTLSLGPALALQALGISVWFFLSGLEPLDPYTQFAGKTWIKLRYCIKVGLLLAALFIAFRYLLVRMLINGALSYRCYVLYFDKIRGPRVRISSIKLDSSSPTGQGHTPSPLPSHLTDGNGIGKMSILTPIFKGNTPETPIVTKRLFDAHDEVRSNTAMAASTTMRHSQSPLDTASATKSQATPSPMNTSHSSDGGSGSSEDRASNNANNNAKRKRRASKVTFALDDRREKAGKKTPTR